MTTLASPTITPQDVLDFNDADFKGLVDDDLRGDATADEAAALRSPEVVDRWIAVLTSMHKSVEGQLAAKKLDFSVLSSEARSKMQQVPAMEDKIRRLLEEEQRKYEKSRASSIRFKAGVEQTLTQAVYLRDSFFPDKKHLVDERNELLRRVWALEAAIGQHRARTLDADDETDQDEIDEALWSLIPEKD